ncbi:IclR family transcriptional regulator [Zobellia galactanivorans]|uniref:IclR-type transcriptional regulator n=1 Tax=Zobellia galactanivorans (strain DSM 12802 / CCUG 47099 / CIP 106680 / NCIMB 13871 / Dsij) TaxID=63186 RepID=G0L4N2_ZOBGA|nr:IclR family transcriptional regulator [Zobellia galactanivorans]MDO6808133.1 IclR family transcriptional regulator [Zobellia galactanivorans]CAZ98800.1 IclR-type transcriptional regulator [Zobellia galactanivorans]
MKKPKAELKSTYNVPNLERGLSIIELLATRTKGMTLAEITETLSITKSSAFRIVSTLIFKNYLQKNETTKKITLSRKMLTLGISSMNEQSIVEHSIDVMRALRDELKESVMLGVLLGSTGTILEQVPSSYPVKLFVEPGTQFDLHSSVGGKCILAHIPSEEADMALNGKPLTKFTENTITSKKQFKRVLKEVREKGYAVDNSEDIEGINCVGAPIFNEYGYPVAALWITAPYGRLPASQFESKGKIVMKYALVISTKLGYLTH